MSIDLSNKATQINWWDASDPDEARDRLTSFYQKVRDDDEGRLSLLNRHMRMYGNMPIDSAGMMSMSPANEERVRLNVVKACCDTVTAKITKNSPMPLPETSGGNWSMQRRAKFLKKFFEAQFYISNVPEIATDVFLDCAISGTGIMKLYAKHGEIRADRIYPGEIFVEKMDGMERRPRMIVHRKSVDKRALSKMFPKHEVEILLAGRQFEPSGDLYSDDQSDHVMVLEAWREPSKPGASDGCHMIVTENATLVKDKWDTKLPFVFLRWTHRPRGFWGVGLAEELTGIQVEINRLLQKIQAAMHLVSVPRVFVEEGSKIVKAFLNNKVGMVIPYRGQKPIFEVPNAVHPEMFAHLNWLYVKAFEISGINQIHGSGRLPELSGVALNTYHDIESERFATTARGWERMHIDIADQMVYLAKSIGGKFVLKNDKFSIARVDWKDIDMKRDAFVIRVEPASSLPSTPVGRLQFVEQMLNSGLIDDPKEGKRLLNYPDFESDLALDEASRDNIKRILEMIVDEGQYEAPEPYIDLQLGLKMAQAEYNRVIQYEDFPEEHLDLLRRWMSMVHVMMKAAMAEQQALAAPPAAGAPPPPGPTGQAPMAVTPSDGAF